MATNEYIYTPLDEPQAQFRLLKVLPYKDNAREIVECRLTVHSLAVGRMPSYSALSYVWGDPNITTRIHVNGRTLRVTTNLYAALLQSRNERFEMLWWVDAICINQQDNDEKSHQIQSMARIYRQAAVVNCWLGAGDANSKRAMRVLGNLADLAQSIKIPGLTKENLELSRRDHARTMTELYEPIFSRINVGAGDLASVITFLGKPYWRRLWTFQEISLPRLASIACGSDDLSLCHFQYAIILLKWLHHFAKSQPLGYSKYALQMKELYQPFAPTSGCFPSALILRSRAEFSEGFASDAWDGLSLIKIFDSLRVGEKLCASNPRDYVYALLGMMKDEDRRRVTVDYSFPLARLFVQSTVLILESIGLTALTYAGISQRRNSCSDLPSWAVDWSYTEGLPWGMSSEYSKCSSRWVRNGHLLIISEAAKVAQVIDTVPFSGSIDESPRTVEDLSIVIGRCHPTMPPHLIRQKVAHTLRQSLLKGLSEYAFLELLKKDTRLRPPPRMPNQSGHGESQSKPHSCTNQSAESLTTCSTISDNTDESLSFKHCDVTGFPRNFVITREGLTGWGLPGTHTGDSIYLFKGCEVPFIMRIGTGEDEGRWKLIGPGFAYAIDDYSCGRFNTEAFWRSDPPTEEIILY